MKTITLINGDGIGPEISQSVVKIIEKSGLKLIGIFKQQVLML